MKKFNDQKLIWIVIFCFSNLACSMSPHAAAVDNKQTKAQMPELEKTWQLTNLLTGSAMVSAYPGATLSLQQGKISGNSTCNNYFGSYQIQGKQLTIKLGGSSMMACAESEKMAQEQRYFELLSQVAGYQFMGKKLQLLNAQGQPVLILSAAE